MIASTVSSLPPSSLLPYFGPGRAGQVMPALRLDWLMPGGPRYVNGTMFTPQLGDDATASADDGHNKSLVGAVLVVGLGFLALGAVALINEHKHHPRRRR